MACGFLSSSRQRLLWIATVKFTWVWCVIKRTMRAFWYYHVVFSIDYSKSFWRVLNTP